MPRNKALDLVRYSVSFFQTYLVTIKQNLEKENIRNSNLLLLIDCLCKPNLIESEYMIFKNLTELGYLVLPKTYVINRMLVPILHENDTTIKETINSVKLMPLKEMFFAFFNKTNVIKDILAYIDYINNLNSEFIYNIIQSKLWNAKIKEIDCVDTTLLLPLIIYFDDFEPNNALGSRSGSHKIGGVYIKIGCLPEHINSKLAHIYAAMFFFTEDRKYKHFGNTRILAPLIEDLNNLVNIGIKLTNHDKFTLVKLVPIFITGDNLGINSILGFQECFVANHFCRFCKIHKDDSYSLCVDCLKYKRNRENYKCDVRLQDPKQTGTKEESVWNSLSHFHELLKTMQLILCTTCLKACSIMYYC